MSKVLIGLAVIFLAGCSRQQDVNSKIALETKIADMEKTIEDLKPGLGEIMGVISTAPRETILCGNESELAPG